jgi:hypothetical protein
VEVVLTISCKARTDTACSSTNTHDAKSGQQTLNSKNNQEFLFEKPSTSLDISSK